MPRLISFPQQINRLLPQAIIYLALPTPYTYGLLLFRGNTTGEPTPRLLRCPYEQPDYQSSTTETVFVDFVADAPSMCKAGLDSEFRSPLLVLPDHSGLFHGSNHVRFRVVVTSKKWGHFPNSSIYDFPPCQGCMWETPRRGLEALFAA
jgi:hypothetical protein